MGEEDENNKQNIGEGWGKELGYGTVWEEVGRGRADRRKKKRPTGL